MAKIYYVGDWAVLTGPSFCETPFYHSPKGLDIFNYGKWLKEALEKNGEHQVESVPSWEFYKMAPGDYEKVLDEYDVLIFSDVDAKLFQLSPAFFDRKEFGTQVLTFPDRIRLTVEAVQKGKSMVFLGGWYSFTGEQGKGGWGRTRLKEILPVQCLDFEDLVENTEGFTMKATPEGASLFDGVPLESCPPILGYNETKPVEGAQILATVAETGAPMVALRDVGAGRVVAFMSDPAPHWGCNFVFWEYYSAFWDRCISVSLKR